MKAYQYAKSSVLATNLEFADTHKYFLLIHYYFTAVFNTVRNISSNRSSKKDTLKNVHPKNSKVS